MTSDDDRTLENLRRDAELFRHIVESATEYAIFATDRDGRIVAWNSGAERILGYSEAEATGQDARIIFTPEDNQQGRPHHEMREALRTGRAEDRRWHVRKGGGRFWADGFVMPLRDEAGGHRGFVKVLRDRTAAKQNDQALHESRALYRAIAANLPSGAVFLVDRELRYRLADGEALRRAGFTPADLEGKTIREVFPPDLAERFESEYRSLLAAEVFQTEHEANGRFYSSHGVPLRDASGAVYAALVVSYDITERKRTEIQLAEARERLDAALAAAEAGTWVYDIGRGVVTVDANLARMFGIPPEEAARGASLDDYIALCHPEDRERVRRSFDEAIVGGTRWESEHRSHQVDGEYRWVIARAVVERDDRGHPVRMPGVVVDVTDRKRAEEERERFFSVAADMLGVTGPDGVFKRVNPAWRQVFGWTPEEMTSRPWLDFVHPDDREATIAEAEKLFEGHMTIAFENRYRAKDGSYRWLRWRARPFLEEGLFYAAATDITEQKELERALRHRARELAEADQRKNEFLAMLAHELRNPLSAIHSAVRVAQSPKMAEHLPHTLEIIERQAKNLTRLIDDLLDVSRITQGKVELKRETVDVIAVINRAAQAVKPLIEQKRHELTFHHDFGPLPVDADPTRLEQIVGNLLTNAAKYTEPGGRLSVSARRDGQEAVIRVKDNGVGIPPEMLPEVFDLFTQVDRSLARSEGGLGIGLSLVKQLVEMHGGSIAATSEVGRGTEFTVRLPHVRVAAEPTRPERRAEVSGGGRRVFVVDDNADTARLTGRLLKSMGFEVQLCHDGREAIERAREFRPEVVLLDIGLPGMNGFEVARQLRQEACCPDSLIIGVSGYGDQQAREQGREAGFDHHLVKPVDIEAVTELVSRPRHP